MRVKLTYPFDFQTYVEKDTEADQAVGRRAQHSGVGTNGVRDLIWETLTFEEAAAIKSRLNAAGFEAVKIDEV